MMAHSSDLSSILLVIDGRCFESALCMCDSEVSERIYANNLGLLFSESLSDPSSHFLETVLAPGPVLWFLRLKR